MKGLNSTTEPRYLVNGVLISDAIHRMMKQGRIHEALSVALTSNASSIERIGEKVGERTSDGISVNKLWFAMI